VIAPQSRYPDESLWSVRRQQSDPLGFLRALAARGDFVRFTLSRQPAVLVNRPDYAASILGSRAAAFQKGSANRRAKRLLGEGLLTAEGDRHAARRRAIQPVFGRQRLEGCASVIVERACETCDAWRPGQIVDITRCMGALTFGVLGEVIVGTPDPRGFGHELRQTLGLAHAPFIITVDPDFAGPMTFLADLWARRHDAEVIVASRYVPGSRVEMPLLRTVGSRLLNLAFRRGLSLGVNDGSSAIRLFRADVLRSLQLEAADYDVLQETLVRAHAAGWRVLEIPLHYTPNANVHSKAHLSLTFAYLRTFWTLWKLRNSIAAADYDYRAHDSAIPLQRYWQRSRYRHITGLIQGQGRVLDRRCDAEMPDLRIGEDLVHRIDRPRRHAGIVEALDPFGAVARLGNRLDRRVERLAVF